MKSSIFNELSYKSTIFLAVVPAFWLILAFNFNQNKMYGTFRILCFLAFATLFFSCKNEPKNDAEVVVEQVQKPIVKERKILTQDDKNQMSSVLAKIMVIPELKMFTSALVSAGLTDILAKDAGPFTVFAPSNAAFQALPKERAGQLLNPVNKEKLATLLKSHIVEGNFDADILRQNIKSNGNFKMKTLAGTELTVSKSGNSFLIKDAKNAKAKVGEAGISGFNGVVFVIDAVLAND